MITRLYADNYRCFTNFTWEPGKVCLLVGDNGTGKSSLFDLMETLRDIVTDGKPMAAAFPNDSRTEWDKRREQTFEMEVEGNDGRYVYRLVVEHDLDGKKNRIRNESLYFNDTRLYEYMENEAHLYADDGAEGPVFPFDWSRSAIATIPERKSNARLTWFRERLERILVLSPNPLRMLGVCETELVHPDRSMQHLASWIRHLIQERSGFGNALRASLADVFQGFSDLTLEKTWGGERILKLYFSYDANPETSEAARFSPAFGRLSEGQRSLVALYAILHGAIEHGYTVCIDEPDNFISLREIQPWIRELRDAAEEHECQCLLVSHHPEIIDYIIEEYGQIFYRDDLGPIRVKPFDGINGNSLPPSQIVACGWE